MPSTQTTMEAIIQRFRKDFVHGHGPIANGHHDVQEADSWVEPLKDGEGDIVADLENFIRAEVSLAVAGEREKLLQDFESFLYDNLGTDQKSGEIAFAFKDFKKSLSTLTP